MHLSDFHCTKNKGTAGAASLHLILPKTRRQPGGNVSEDSEIKKWYSQFIDGRISVDSEPRSGRPSTSRN